jgi:hypothetical protein
MQDIPLSSVVDLEVYDKTGAKVRFGDIFKDEKVAMVFIRETCIAVQKFCRAHRSSVHPRPFPLRGMIIFYMVLTIVYLVLCIALPSELAGFCVQSTF